MEDLERRALAAKFDREIFDRLAEEEKRFIRKQAYYAAGHFVSESDEEWSVALLAFYEAVQAYEESKGNFHSFAAMVIRRRILDHMKKERRRAREIPVGGDTLDSDIDEENVSAMDYEISERAAERSRGNGPEQTLVQLEIEALGQELNRYGFSFFDLPDCSPKAGKTRVACRKAIRAMLEHPILVQKLEDRRSLPMRDLMEYSGVSKKILDRHRRYIITCALILTGEYPEISEYLRDVVVNDVSHPAAGRGAVPGALMVLLLALAI